MDEAEERTIHYYCIPPYRWQQLRYDLVTRRDCEWEPLPDAALAQVQLVHHVRPSGKAACDFYRIQLNDPSILIAALRENLGPDLYPFLVYILTHEMVHLVRLSTILPDERGIWLSPAEEENRVHNVAYRILSSAPDRQMAPILSKFCLANPHDLPASGQFSPTGASAVSHS
jgi:hypothetical protein